MAEFLILVLVVVWLVDRARLQRRIDSIESTLDRLTRESATNRRARGQSEAAPGIEPTAPPPRPTSTPRTDTAVPQPGDERVDALLDRIPAEPRAVQPMAATSTVAARSDAGIDSAFPGLRQIREFFTGGNLIVRVGVIVLFFGVAFLLRYAAEHSHLSIETRLSGVAGGAIVLLALGWHWRGARRGYALALQGGGVGILYLTTFTAQHIYGVLAPGAAFILLALVALLSAALAIRHDSMSFAILGATGGYLAPVLAVHGPFSRMTSSHARRACSGTPSGVSSFLLTFLTWRVCAALDRSSAAAAYRGIGCHILAAWRSENPASRGATASYRGREAGSLGAKTPWQRLVLREPVLR